MRVHLTGCKSFRANINPSFIKIRAISINFASVAAAAAAVAITTTFAFDYL